MEQINSLILPNGIIVLYEHIEHVRSILLGCWVKLGSREEPPELQGMTHFLEHMLFKGSSKRSALEIAQSLELVGGELNGFTSRENCCYYGKVTNDNLPLLCDVLSDLMFRPLLDSKEMKQEKEVVCQEIDMIEDSFEELVHEELVAIMFDENLGHPVLGTKEHVRSFRCEEVKTFHKKLYHPSNIFLTAVGNLNSFDFEKIASQQFGQIEFNESPFKGLSKSSAKPAQYKLVTKDIEQMHMVMGWHAFSVQHEMRYVLHLISAYLGNGMSSVLFQQIREELGLTYNIYSFIRAYRDAGIFGIYAGHAPQNLSILHREILRIITDLINHGIDQNQLEQLKAQLKGNLLLGLEKTAFRMNRMGVGHLYFNHILSPDELIELINKVDPQDVQTVARQIFGERASVVAVGRMSHSEFTASLSTGS